MSQSYATHSTPSQGVNETETNTAQNATNDTQSKTTATQNSDGGCHAGGTDEVITPGQAKNGLPEQKHAGAVGYGPEYAIKNGATLGDKITGIKDQVVGTVTRNPELVQMGHDKKTGELKRREQEKHEIDPFVTEDKLPSSPGTTASHSTITEANGYATGSIKSYTDIKGGKPTDVDLAAGKSHVTADSSQHASDNEDIRLAGGI